MGAPKSEGERRNLRRLRLILMYVICQHGKPRHHTQVGWLATITRGSTK
jgi:hypothetical protein